MAKRATNKPSTATAAAKPLSPEVLIIPPVETPPGFSGVLPPVAPLSEIVVTDAAGDASKLDTDHPAIALAQSFVTPHGKPDSEMGSYYTPPPPELRKPKVKA